MVELRNLKHKSRIYVEEGATLYGIMDETNTLQEGEIFITLDTKEWRHKVVVGERIVITRAPALVWLSDTTFAGIIVANREIASRRRTCRQSCHST